MATELRAVPRSGNGVPDAPIWRLGVEQYHAMVAAGILDEDAPVELLEGWLVTKMGRNPRHRLATRRVRVCLERLLPAGWFVDAQEAITTTDSEPEPDIAVIKGDPEQYPDRHPGPEDIALLIEVADSSLRQDRVQKKRIYARAGIRVYWIVNVVDRQIEVYTTPSGPGAAPDYAERRDYGADEVVPVVVDGREVGRIAVGDVLPEA